MPIQYEKVDENTFKEIVPKETPFTIKALKRKLTILAETKTKIDARINEVNFLLSKAEELGVTEKIDVTP